MKLEIPPVVFKIIWPILYFLLFLSILCLYLEPKTKTRTIQIWLFWFSIFFNLLWIFLYFYLEKKFLAFLDLCIMIVLLSILLYYSIPNKSSSKKMKFIFSVFILYFIWLCIAFYLSILKWKDR